MTLSMGATAVLEIAADTPPTIKLTIKLDFLGAGSGAGVGVAVGVGVGVDVGVGVVAM